MGDGRHDIVHTPVMLLYLQYRPGHCTGPRTACVVVTDRVRHSSAATLHTLKIRIHDRSRSNKVNLSK